MKGMQQIRKLYLMIHPVCWRVHGDIVPPDAEEKKWLACLHWEQEVNHA